MTEVNQNNTFVPNKDKLPPCALKFRIVFSSLKSRSSSQSPPLAVPCSCSKHSKIHDGRLM